MSERRVFAAGCADSLCRQIGSVLECDVRAQPPETFLNGDVLFIAIDAREVARGNAFSACRDIKDRREEVRVFVVIDEDDDRSEEIARFCLATGCVRVDANGELCEPESLAAKVDPSFRAVPVDALLQRLEGYASDEQRTQTALQRLAEKHADHAFIDGLTDDETGLFDGPFASFKLDEEYKRAVRFHQPLSLILLDCGGSMPADASDRRTVLAEIASVFLNECRDIDVLARFTEAVFMFLLPGTGSDGAATVARRMLDELGAREFSVPIELEPAAGIATVPMTGVRDRKEFLARAEACLDLARHESDRAGLCAL